MQFFSKFLRTSKKTSPTVQFGRYSDLNQREDKFIIWEEALQNFEKKKYIYCIKGLLDFLKREEVDNVNYYISKGIISFRILQGSKIIEGFADHKHIKAYARIVKMTSPNLSLMREALEDNYELEYSRYAMNSENYLLLIFDSFIEDASPQKVYKGIKELASLADKKDDVLLNNFDNLTAVNIDHITPVSAAEKTVKFNFFSKRLEYLFDELENDSLNYNKYPGGLSYQILSFIYKIDFLVKPEGFIMENIKKIHDIHITNNSLSINDKNFQMLKIIRTFTSINYELFEKEIYNVISTFGEAYPVKYDKITEIIHLQFDEAQWYYTQGHKACALAIWDYVAGIILFSYALPKPLEDLFLLYFQIRENTFFNDLGFDEPFRKNDGQINIKKVTKVIQSILSKYRDSYPNWQIDLKNLNNKNEFLFAHSFMTMIRDLQIPQ